ncbi:hypothetical protein PN416_09840 [Halorubrum ezzemoulense]|uniref:Uncharacterized protein n=1 Tax=Halorubrum ezzemoulense TaxID=337243 RepID=A0ABT4Z861_HALEZ|nr:hypothetical protein [Halorubrum ezzemoulense]MDB2294361.1 hypothetical protein [Halorubrum ezzemoulense]MDB9280222.1 hypothetical protein [Halorubrum ezzemoulense]MDB9283740.1 hypothetical protein [Halorubrum ezzemoulense]
MAVTSDWADATVPTDAELTRIPKPSDLVVREIAERARSLDGDEEIVSWGVDGFVRPRGALLDALLFPPRPADAAIVDGDVVLTFWEPLEIEGHGESVVRCRIRADADTRSLESVSLWVELL